MKIGILTLYLHTNYGGILQAYALQTVLEKMGHEVVVFSKQKKKSLPLWKWPITYSKRVLKKYILGKDIIIFAEQHFNKLYLIISKNTQLFISKYIHEFKIESLSKLSGEDFDAIIVGSDQVWRPKYFTSIVSSKLENAYLDFTNEWTNVKRVAYAASFGTDSWEYSLKKTRSCGKLLKTFDGVSVREESGVQLCSKYFGVKAQHVLDPTMLLNKEEYIHLFEIAKTPKSEGTLLCYILDSSQEKDDIIDFIAKERGLIPFSLNTSIDYSKSAMVDAKLSVEQWLRGFYDAKLVVTDSFHACVFSIIFNKPFVVVGNRERGMARFNSLLEMFDLEDCMVGSLYECERLSFSNINFKDIQQCINEMQNHSTSYLKDSLG